jgi:uncharacterized membrane protein
MEEQKASVEATSDDRLWAALSYVFTPFFPILIMLLEDKKDRPFIRAHNMQALIWGLILMFTGFTLVGFCIWPFLILAQLYWAYKAYQGEMVNIPIISNFVKGQGWA